MVKLVALPKFKSKEDMVFFWSRTWLTQNRLHVCWLCSSQMRLETILHLVACTIHLTIKNAAGQTGNSDLVAIHSKVGADYLGKNVHHSSF